MPPEPARRIGRSRLSAAALLCVLLTAGCGHRGRVSEATYASIEQLFVSGDLAAAQRQVTQALGRRPPLSKTQAEALDTARLCLLQAKISLYQGHSPEALRLLTPPLPSGADASLAATRSTLLAMAYVRTGDSARAHQTIALARSLAPDPRSRAAVWLAQGVIDAEDEQMTKAAHDFALALDNAQASHDRFAQTQALSNLAVMALRQEHYDEALSRLTQATTLAREIGAGLALEKAAGNLGRTYYKLGDYRRALVNSRVAEERARALDSPLDQVAWSNDIGLSQFRLGDLDGARASYEQSVRLARSLHNDEEESGLAAVGYLSLQQGRLDDALAQARAAKQLALKRNNRIAALEPSLVEALAMARQGELAAAGDNLRRLELAASAKESIRWEIQHALANVSEEAGESAQADLWFRRAIATYRMQRASVTGLESRLPFVENGSTLYYGYMEFLIRHGREQEALAVLDESRGSTLAEGLVHAEPPRPEAVARRLGGTLLVYCLRPRQSYLWVVTPRLTTLLRLPGQDLILPLVASHARAILASKDLLAKADPPGQALYRMLVAPASPLVGRAAKFYVVAGQGLNGLNFETLVTDNDRPHYWIDDADIVDARSISLLAGARAAPGRRVAPRLLLVGDPSYTRPEQGRLEHASEEVSSISRSFEAGNRLVLTGADATPSAYRRSTPESFGLIHFVAHGAANETVPLDSSVVLSASPAEPEAYRLYARDILKAPLTAELVTISACYGSGTGSYSGEGLVGLAWAFLRAGAHNVIGSLWEVSDISTPQLMGDMYAGLARGASPDQALRAAKLAMIHHDGVFRKPFYWAAFQLYAGM